MANNNRRFDADVDPMRYFRLPDNPKASPARLFALAVTQEVRLRDAFAHNVLEARINEYDYNLSPEDRGFATTLVLGVVQTRGTLDEIINMALDNPEDIKPNVRDALRISTYELVFLDKSSHAAVDQGVELVRSVVPRAANLGNAVLRRIVKLADQFPFGDPDRDKAAFARQQAFPLWLAKILDEDLGEVASRSHMAASNDPAPLFIGVNAAKVADDQEVIDVLKAAHSDVEPVTVGGLEAPGCYRVSNTHVLNDGRVRRLLAQGKILVSDASAQSIANMVVQGAYACWDKRGKQTAAPSVLEIGAGRATKTILLQSDSVRLAGGQMELTTVDNQAFKVKLLKKRVQEYGVEVKKALEGDATDLDAVVGDTRYDCVFLDSPCTGLGTLRRHPEIRWRIRSKNIKESARLSLALLESAAAHVAVGGMVVYATCTVTKQENVGVLRAFLDSELGQKFRLLPINDRPAFASALTHGSPDAHFAARLVRIAE